MSDNIDKLAERIAERLQVAWPNGHRHKDHSPQAVALIAAELRKEYQTPTHCADCHNADPEICRTKEYDADSWCHCRCHQTPPDSGLDLEAIQKRHRKTCYYAAGDGCLEPADVPALLNEVRRLRGEWAAELDRHDKRETDLEAMVAALRAENEQREHVAATIERLCLCIVASVDGWYAIRPTDIEHGRVSYSDQNYIQIIGEDGQIFLPAETLGAAVEARIKELEGKK